MNRDSVKNKSVLIVYDSFFGNTEKVAIAISDALKEKYNVKYQRAKVTSEADFSDIDLLIMGVPTRGGMPTPDITNLLKTLKPETLKNVDFTTFDTRYESQAKGFALRMLMAMIKYAAEKIAKSLESLGGTLIQLPEGFIVTGQEGPLKDGELERAADWARNLRF
jgi:flavodoxin